MTISEAYHFRVVFRFLCSLVFDLHFHVPNYFPCSLLISMKKYLQFFI